MAFTRCRRCHHYNDVHAEDEERSTKPCVYFDRSGEYCPCNDFEAMGDSPEGTDIYRDDPPDALVIGYHIAHIEKGVLGELSKIREELDELMDAESQGATIMELCEAADLVGALRAWLNRHHPGKHLSDLIRMADLTERAFKSGRRK